MIAAVIPVPQIIIILQIIEHNNQDLVIRHFIRAPIQKMRLLKIDLHWKI
jgi:hypothetical protein